MKVFSLVGVLLIMTGCNNAKPTATVYKEQLGAPSAVTGNNSPSTGGDAAKGQTALAACTACHVEGGTGRVLTAADADSIKNSGPVTSQPAFHSALASTFTQSGADMAAYLKGETGSTGGTSGGDATAGTALLQANCESCHNPDGTGLAPALDSFSSLEGQETNASHASILDFFAKDGEKRKNIEAALKARA